MWQETLCYAPRRPRSINPWIGTHLSIHLPVALAWQLSSICLRCSTRRAHIPQPARAPSLPAIWTGPGHRRLGAALPARDAAKPGARTEARYALWLAGAAHAMGVTTLQLARAACPHPSTTMVVKIGEYISSSRLLDEYMSSSRLLDMGVVRPVPAAGGAGCRPRAAGGRHPPAPCRTHDVRKKPTRQFRQLMHLDEIHYSVVQRDSSLFNFKVKTWLREHGNYCHIGQWWYLKKENIYKCYVEKCTWAARTWLIVCTYMNYLRLASHYQEHQPT